MLVSIPTCMNFTNHEDLLFLLEVGRKRSWRNLAFDFIGIISDIELNSSTELSQTTVENLHVIDDRFVLVSDCSAVQVRDYIWKWDAEPLTQHPATLMSNSNSDHAIL